MKSKVFLERKSKIETKFKMRLNKFVHIQRNYLAIDIKNKYPAAHIAIAVPILALVVSWLFASIGDITNAMDTNKRLPRPL